MNQLWQCMVDCLRAELAEYGELLRLFESQQRSLIDRDPDQVLQLAHAIERQAQVLGETRGRREETVARHAREHGLPETSTVRALLPTIPAPAQPLFEALINEIHLLLHRVRRTSRHNAAMLARTVELHQETLLQLQPQAFTRTYSPAGRVSMNSAQQAPSLSASG